MAKINWYNKINAAIREYEWYKPYKQYSIDWICSYIDWCWKWRKITEAQKDELCDRIIKVMEEDR